MFEHLRVDRRPDDVVAVTIDRPPANSLNDELLREITTLAYDLQHAPPHVVTVASAQRIFMAGADLGTLKFSAQFMAPFNSLFQGAINAWADIPAPTIALINGHAMGGGMELALACDWRIMTRGSHRIGLPEIHRGLLAAAGGTQRVTRLLGVARAKDLVLRGRLLSADEALEIGLVSAVCEPEELGKHGETLVQELLGLPKLALQAAKRCIDEGSNTTLLDGMAVERREVLDLTLSEDTREGVQAFLEKREPVWVNR